MPRTVISNREWFAGLLPEGVTIRLSQRMVRRFGHVEYRRVRGQRVVAEIALNIDLMIEGNERPLLDTLMHEMAHVEAWVRCGHVGHGEPWRRIALRVGCEVNASSHMRIRRRRNTEVTWVPDLDSFLMLARRRMEPRRPALRKA